MASSDHRVRVLLYGDREHGKTTLIPPVGSLSPPVGTLIPTFEWEYHQVGTALGRAHSQQLEQEGDSMSEHYDEARHVLGEYIRSALDASDVKRLWYTEDREGPMGGVSTQVCGYLELEDGTIAPFAINIYSDHNIERAMQARLDDEERQRALRERLES